jgi:hypothetical protein
MWVGNIGISHCLHSHLIFPSWCSRTHAGFSIAVIEIYLFQICSFVYIDRRLLFVCIRNEIRPENSHKRSHFQSAGKYLLFTSTITKTTASGGVVQAPKSVVWECYPLGGFSVLRPKNSNSNYIQTMWLFVLYEKIFIIFALVAAILSRIISQLKTKHLSFVCLLLSIKNPI